MLKTEERNAKTTHVDKMSTDEMLAIMQEENVNAVNAVALAQKSISRAVDEIALRLNAHQHLAYQTTW